MTTLERAESLFDEAERQERAGDLAALAERNEDAEELYEHVRECRRQAFAILDQVTGGKSGWRVAG
jgi:hypothetical protein